MVGRSKRDVEEDGFFDQVPDLRGNEAGFDPSVDLPTGFYCSMVNSLPRGCLLSSILDIWEFDSSLIKKQTKEEIIDKFNAATTSPTLGHPVNFTELLSGVTRDERGRIIAAKAVQSLWFVHVNYSDVKMDETGNDAGTADWVRYVFATLVNRENFLQHQNYFALFLMSQVTVDVLNWEAQFLKELESSSRYLNSLNGAGTNEQVLKLWYQAGRSWSDISSSTMFQDTSKIVFGVILMSVYVQFILSRFNWVEWRVSTLK